MGGLADHRTTKLRSPIRAEGKKPPADLIQIARQRSDLPDPVAIRANRVVAVFIKCYLQFRGVFIALGSVKLIDDFPKLRAGLVDQAFHGATGIQQQCQLHPGSSGVGSRVQQGTRKEKGGGDGTNGDRFHKGSLGWD